MVTTVAIAGGQEARALRLTQRMERLGLPNAALAARAGVDRETVARARDGEARSSTYGKLERALTDLEEEVGADVPEAVTAVVELPDGLRVTFHGISAEDAVRAVAEYLHHRDDKA